MEEEFNSTTFQRFSFDRTIQRNRGISAEQIPLQFVKGLGGSKELKDILGMKFEKVKKILLDIQEEKC